LAVNIMMKRVLKFLTSEDKKFMNGRISIQAYMNWYGTAEI